MTWEKALDPQTLEEGNRLTKAQGKEGGLRQKDQELMSWA